MSLNFQMLFDFRGTSKGTPLEYIAPTTRSLSYTVLISQLKQEKCRAVRNFSVFSPHMYKKLREFYSVRYEYCATASSEVIMCYVATITAVGRKNKSRALRRQLTFFTTVSRFISLSTVFTSVTNTS